jgi:uncharacterized metal-binding protein YceD (DUF177 family)
MTVKTLAPYDVDIYGLKDKQYAYHFKSGNDFFAALGQEMIHQGLIETDLTIDKSSTMLQLKFHIVGSVELTCDRSLEEFDEPIDVTRKLILKFGDHNEELSEDLEMIRYETTRINVARYIFEFIALSLPMKKLHPRFRKENGDDDNQEVEFVFGDEPPTTTNDETPIDESKIDPRWAALQQLKNKN